VALASTQPGWWYDAQTGIFAGGAHDNDHYEPVNVGQLKHVATQAKKHLDILSGGAGTAISNLVNSFTSGPNPEHFAPLNVGQLKNVVKLFYDRLQSAGYNTRESLILMGYPLSWPTDNPYPWDTQAPSSEHYAPVNIGQLKLVFSFDLQRDSNGDGLTDYFKWENGLTVIQETTPGNWEYVFDSDGDGLWDVHEYDYDHTDPLTVEAHLIVYAPKH
jgi:hypothetical protein